jgi:hypothetical protein
VAAVEDQDLPAGAAVVHEVLQVGGRDAGGARPVVARPAQGEEQPAPVVADAVAGEVEEHEVVAVLVGEEVVDRSDQRLAARFDQRDDAVEGGDGGVLEDLGQRLDVCRRGLQAREPRVGVPAHTNQKCVLPRHRRPVGLPFQRRA